MSAKAGRGLVMVFTGPGKGKTTAALGCALRAWGQGLRVRVVQFIKGQMETGERRALGQLPGLEMRSMGLGRVRPGDALADHRDAARGAWDLAAQSVRQGDCDMLVLDEVCIAAGCGFVSPEELTDLIRDKPPEMHLVLTGRGCPEDVLGQADLVTEMQAVKHHLDAGVTAQKGIEF